MKNNIKNFFYGLLLSITSLAVCFFALAVPFQLFNEISSFGIKILFICEIVVYAMIAIICLIIKDKNNRKKQKSKQRQLERKEKIKKMQDEWLNIAA